MVWNWHERRHVSEPFDAERYTSQTPLRRHCHVEAKALLRICRSYKFEAGGRYLQKHMNILLLFFYEFKIINSSVPPCYIAS